MNLLTIPYHSQDNWQPALQRLVDSIGQKFSAAFDRKWFSYFYLVYGLMQSPYLCLSRVFLCIRTSGIGCAGEIRIHEDEDYDKWAIDILVKFRDSEKLQLLTAHRQSGGVRYIP